MSLPDPTEILSTTTTGSIPQPDAIPMGEAHDHTDVSWQPDVAALQGAKGDPYVWAHQFSELVGHTTGSWIDESTFSDWLNLFAAQVAQAANRAALFQVANQPLPANVAGDPAMALLDLRDDIAHGFRKGAGL